MSVNVTPEYYFLRKLGNDYTAILSPTPNTSQNKCISVVKRFNYLKCLLPAPERRQVLFLSCNTNYDHLTLNLLTTTTVAPPSNASKWQMGFNSAFNP
jgi:hypothetical protein